VKVVDANVLLYAVNESAERHDDPVTWLDVALNGRSTVSFSWSPRRSISTCSVTC
jgi:predicted nucleic acid-binding protein